MPSLRGPPSLAPALQWRGEQQAFRPSCHPLPLCAGPAHEPDTALNLPHAASTKTRPTMSTPMTPHGMHRSRSWRPGSSGTLPAAMVPLTPTPPRPGRSCVLTSTSTVAVAASVAIMMAQVSSGRSGALRLRAMRQRPPIQARRGHCWSRRVRRLTRRSTSP